MDDLRELFELTAALAADFYETLPGSARVPTGNGRRSCTQALVRAAAGAGPAPAP